MKCYMRNQIKQIATMIIMCIIFKLVLVRCDHSDEIENERQYIFDMMKLNHSIATKWLIDKQVCFIFSKKKKQNNCNTYLHI